VASCGSADKFCTSDTSPPAERTQGSALPPVMSGVTAASNTSR
jgi:hypothetical protein